MLTMIEIYVSDDIPMSNMTHVCMNQMSGGTSNCQILEKLLERYWNTASSFSNRGEYPEESGCNNNKCY